MRWPTIAETLYIEPKYGNETMEVLLGDEPFARLIEEHMGADARRYFDELCDGASLSGYERGYNEGYDNGYATGFDDGID